MTVARIFVPICIGICICSNQGQDALRCAAQLHQPLNGVETANNERPSNSCASSLASTPLAAVASRTETRVSEASNRRTARQRNCRSVGCNAYLLLMLTV